MSTTAPTELLQRWWDELERLSKLLGQVGPDEICCAGLTPRQCAILRTLTAEEGARLSDLAASSGITPSAMTRVLERLEARGLVERVRGTQKDGRAAMVRITSAGRRTRRQLDDLMRSRTDTILNSVPAAERENVLRAIQILNQGIQASGCCGLNAPVIQLTEIED